MKLLLTNDDGIDAPGLAAMEAAVQLALESPEVIVAAPHQGFSGCGHLVTYPSIQVETVSAERFKVHAAPADCSRIGIKELAKNTEVVLSGINEGGNLGVDIWMSGTVAAVREAGWLKIPGIAISQYCDRRRERSWEKSAKMAALVLKHVLTKEGLGAGKGWFWNANLPDVDTSVDELAIIETFIEPEHLHVAYEQEENGHYRYCGDYRGRPRTSGSDVDVCFGGNISLTKIPWPGFG